MMSVKSLLPLVLSAAAVDAGCSFLGGCLGCQHACASKYGFKYFCCFSNSCCCYPPPSECTAAGHPACPTNYCVSNEAGAIVNGTSPQKTTCGIAAGDSGAPEGTKSDVVAEARLAKADGDEIQV